MTMTEPILPARRVPEITHIEPLTDQQITDARRYIQTHTTDPDPILDALGIGDT